MIRGLCPKGLSLHSVFGGRKFQEKMHESVGGNLSRVKVVSRRLEGHLRQIPNSNRPWSPGQLKGGRYSVLTPKGLDQTSHS